MSAKARDFFEAAYKVFQSARAAGERGSETYAIGGTRVRLETASAEMSRQLTRALSHLRLTNQAAEDLTVCAWDASAVDMVAPPWSETDYGPRGEIRGFNDGPFRTAFDHGTGSLNMIDSERKLALFWTSDAAALPEHAAASPLRIIFSWWSDACNAVLVHCGAVALGGDAALLAGAGGSGKSATALLCLQAGWKYLADDYCVISLTPPFRVYSLYSSAKIDQTLLRNARPLHSLQQPSALMHGNKEVLFLNEEHSDQLLPSADCRMMFLPCVTGAEKTRVKSSSAGEALRALAPSSLFQFAGAGSEAFSRLSTLVQGIPVRVLELGY